METRQGAIPDRTTIVSLVICHQRRTGVGTEAHPFESKEYCERCQPGQEQPRFNGKGFSQAVQALPVSSLASYPARNERLTSVAT